MTLAIGSKPDALTINYVTNDAWSVELTLKQNAVAIAWPAAPVIEFPELTPPVSWVATLSGVSNSVATWSISEANLMALHVAAGREPTPARLSVNGLTWWKGTTIPNA